MMTTVFFLLCNYEAKITKCCYVKLRKSCLHFTLAVIAAETLIFSAGVKNPTQLIIPPMQMYFTSLNAFCSCFIPFPFCVPISSQHGLMLLHIRITFIGEKNTVPRLTLETVSPKQVRRKCSVQIQLNNHTGTYNKFTGTVFNSNNIFQLALQIAGMALIYH